MRVLVIAAHADDAELGVGGTISKHTRQDDDVFLVLITHSGYKNYQGDTIRESDVAFKEAKAAGEILGVEDITCLGYETKEVAFEVNLIEDINRVIDEKKPDIIYTHWEGDINQDHSAIARATVCAARNIPRILMYRSNSYISAVPFVGNYYVDISDHIEDKIEAIKAHRTELKKRGEKWPEFFRHQCRMNGLEIGVEYAERFKVVKWLD
jgi:LmbE family N-acetylglucosaminyl deacetylase